MEGTKIGPLGKFALSSVANMDQTPLQFYISLSTLPTTEVACPLTASGGSICPCSDVAELSLFNHDTILCVISMEKKEDSSWFQLCSVSFYD